MTREPLDLRLVPAAVSTWLVIALGLGWTTGGCLAVAAALGVLGLITVGGPTRRRWSAGVGATLLIVAAGLAVAGLRSGAVRDSPVADLAADSVHVEVEAVVTGDPVNRHAAFGDYTQATVVITRLDAGLQRLRLRVPVLVFGDASWSGLRVGDVVRTSGRLAPSRGVDQAALLLADPEPAVVHPAGWVWSGIGGVRSALWRSVDGVGLPQRTLIPALVDGDDSQIPPEVTDDFRVTGLTHLLAVSGSNLTLVLGFVLLVARWLGVRGRGTVVVGVVAVVFFVLLARPQPSVLRAAAMGVVGLSGLALGGRARGIRALGAAVLALLLLDPWLSRSAGFLLSTLATAGIVVLAPGWSAALCRWLPAPLADAVAIPLAAQVACTPVVAAISGQVSLVAVFANLVAAPAVGPATVLGLVAALVELVAHPLAQVVGWLAGLPAWWIVTVSLTMADLDGAAVSWSSSVGSIGLLAGLCLVAAIAMRRLLVRPLLAGSLAVGLIAVLIRPIGPFGWPPHGWLLVMCDVGQGDALVVNVGAGAAVVVDAGPEPRLVERCLDDLAVARVELVVLTHFHADHVDGLPGVFDGRDVGEIEVSPLAVPDYGAAQVAATADEAGVPVTVAQPGEEWEIGVARWQVLGPPATTSRLNGADPDDGSVANNASIVMRLDIGGHTFLLCGDAEPEEQAALLRSGYDLSAEVVKVAHHGSAAQDPEFYAAVGADLGLVSVGADNDYAHPAPSALTMLAETADAVYRTDESGAIAVVDVDGSLAVVTQR